MYNPHAATALITGASSGLGEQFAYALAHQKFALVLTARREKRLAAIAVKAKELGARCIEIIPVDLTRRDASKEISHKLNDAHIEVDYLVNNAGFGTCGKFDQLPLARELEEVDVNVTAIVALTRLMLPAMIRRGHGTIINVASTSAFQSVPYMTTYAATKAFVLSFTEGLAGELAGTGVRVCALCPGPVRTEFQTVAQNEKGLVPASLYIDREAVVAKGISAAARGRTVYIVGALNFGAAQLTRLLPRALVNRLAREVFRPCC